MIRKKASITLTRSKRLHHPSLIPFSFSAAPFNGITQRANPPVAPAQKVNDNPGKNFSAQTQHFVGPGNYQQDKQRIVKGYNEVMQNSFKTTINRFCPTAPGSSIFGPAPTYLGNPASTTYDVNK